MTKTEQVFISHATADAQFAHRLADDLQRLGVQVWIAPESIRPGESWVSAIERGLEESSHMVVVLTPAAMESKWVQKETDVAIARERKGRIQVIPLDVKSCKVPLLLNSYQMVSFRRNYDIGLSQLAAILDVPVTPPQPEVPIPPPVKPVAVAGKKPRPLTAPPTPKAVLKKALGKRVLLAGGLVLLATASVIIVSISGGLSLAPMPGPPTTTPLPLTDTPPPMTTPLPLTDTPPTVITEVSGSEVSMGFTEEGSPYRGDPNAPVTLVEYSDFQ